MFATKRGAMNTRFLSSKLADNGDLKTVGVTRFPLCNASKTLGRGLRKCKNHAQIWLFRECWKNDTSGKNIEVASFEVEFLAHRRQASLEQN